MTKPRRVRVFSDYMAWPHVFNAVVYEFVSVLAQVEEAEVIAPAARPLSRKRDKTLNKLEWQVSRSFKRARPPRTLASRVDEPCDVFVFVGAIMDTLGELKSLEGWQARSGVKIAFVVEAWSAGIVNQGPYLEILKGFDFIFTLHRKTAPLIQQATGVPCAFLPSATDVKKSTPYPVRPKRTIDVLSIGRRLDTVHECLLEMARSSDFFYDYDTTRVSESPVTNWAQHRFLTFSKIKRAQFFTCFDHRTAASHKIVESMGEQVIPARLFEGAACGTVMIGSAPKCDEFGDLFHWPDALIELPTDVSLVPGFLRDLARQSDRLAAARRTNVAESIRAHDWSHRWADILRTAGLSPSTGLLQRQRELAVLASQSRDLETVGAT